MSSRPSLVLIDRTIIVRRPIDETFAFTANHENYALWFPDVISVVSKTAEPHGTVGKVYVETLRMPTGRVRQIEIPVVECDPPNQLATEAEFAPLQPRMEFRLRDLGDGRTEIRWLFSSRARSLLVRFLVKRLFARTMSEKGAVASSRLKELLERSETSLRSSAGSRS